MAEDTRLTTARDALREHELDLAHRLWRAGHRDLSAFRRAIGALAGPASGESDRWADRVYRQMIEASSFETKEWRLTGE